ncbi:MAG: TetR family transcriptional regulator [Micromonosporaceae bacterium]|nr:TetR family transcriptional regulator [Micromonosporaceae bacterium]
MTTTGAGAARPVGRPRSSQASDAIISATLDLLAEGVTIEALTIEAIASRAGVGKATVYRRWPNKEALVIDAIACLKGATPLLPGRSVREDLVTLLAGMGKANDTPEGRIVLAVLPEIRRNPELSARYAAMVDSRREVIREVFRRGLASGELTPDLDVELALAMLSSPMMSVASMRMFPRVSEERLAERIVDLALAGMRGPAPCE